LGPESTLREIDDRFIANFNKTEGESCLINVYTGPIEIPLEPLIYSVKEMTPGTQNIGHFIDNPGLGWPNTVNWFDCRPEAWDMNQILQQIFESIDTLIESELNFWGQLGVDQVPSSSCSFGVQPNSSPSSINLDEGGLNRVGVSLRGDVL